MPRPKGSKNRPKAADVIEQDTVEQDEAAEEILEASGDEYEEEVDEIDEVDEAPAKPPRGMTRVDNISDSTILDAIREQTAALTAAMPPRKVPFSRFKTRNKFNPSGRKRKLKFVIYQNGYRCNPKTLHDAEFEAINSGKIRPGQYLSKIVTVRVDKASSPEDEDKIYISYHNKTHDQRIMNKDHWNGFNDLLNKIVAESEARQLRVKQRRQREAASFQ